MNTIDNKPFIEHVRCTDLIERQRVITDEMVENGWYPDSPSDLIEIVECGAKMRDIVDGVECEAGHTHYYYGSSSQLWDEVTREWEER